MKYKIKYEVHWDGEIRWLTYRRESFFSDWKYVSGISYTFEEAEQKVKTLKEADKKLKAYVNIPNQ